MLPNQNPNAATPRPHGPKTGAFLFGRNRSAPTEGPSPRTLSADASARAQSAAAILVVHSDPVECAQLGRMLCQLGHAVQLVCDGGEAAAILLTTRFNLLIVEVDPPARQAREAIDRLLNNVREPVAVLATSPDSAVAKFSVKIAPLYTITKPATAESILVVLQQVFPH